MKGSASSGIGDGALPPTSNDVDEQPRSGGNTALGIRARYGNVHGWHVLPTNEQFRNSLNTTLSEDLSAVTASVRLARTTH